MNTLTPQDSNTPHTRALLQPSRNVHGQEYRLVNNVCLKCVFHRYKITDKRRLKEEGFALAQGVSKQSPQGMGIPAGGA